MARNTKKITINKGRDKGKTFSITEMSAWDSNRWMISFLKQLAKSGDSLPADISDLGIAGLLAVIQSEGDALKSPTFFKSLMSVASNVDEQDLFPLLDKLLTCVSLITPKGHEIDFTADQIEDSSTFSTLYSEVFQVHVFF